jgi:hypothetical protein
VSGFAFHVFITPATLQPPTLQPHRSIMVKPLRIKIVSHRRGAAVPTAATPGPAGCFRKFRRVRPGGPRVRSAFSSRLSPWLRANPAKAVIRGSQFLLSQFLLSAFAIPFTPATIQPFPGSPVRGARFLSSICDLRSSRVAALPPPVTGLSRDMSRVRPQPQARQYCFVTLSRVWRGGSPHPPQHLARTPTR